MSDRLEVVAFRKRNGKTFATRIGSAQAKRDGNGYFVYLDALPTPDIEAGGQYTFSIQPPRQREEGRAPADFDNGPGDDIPF